MYTFDHLHDYDVMVEKGLLLSKYIHKSSSVWLTTITWMVSYFTWYIANRMVGTGVKLWKPGYVFATH